MWRKPKPNPSRAERWKREDDSARLRDEVPELESLKLELSETRDGRPVPATKRINHIIVASAPAMFELPCLEPKCEDGGHELTHVILRNLHAGETSFFGHDECRGYVGDRPCERVLEFVAHASYHDAKKLGEG